MKRIGLVLLISGYWLLVSGFYTYAQVGGGGGGPTGETLTLITYYPAPYGVYQILEVTNQDPGINTTLNISYFSNTTGNFPLLNFRRARGTMADPESIPTDTFLGSIQFSGCDNSEDNHFDIGARIYALSAAAWSNTEPVVRTTNLRFATSDGDGTLSDRMTIDAAGNVGIGTISPGIISGAQRYLTISIPTPTSATNTNEVSSLELKGQSFQSDRNPIGKIDFIQRIKDGAAASANIARIAGVTTDWDGEGELLFYTKNRNDISPQERMRIDENGNVGIGINDPLEKLDVHGRVKMAIPNIPVFVDNAARDTAIPYPQEGDICWNRSTGQPQKPYGALQIYIDSQWQNEY